MFDTLMEILNEFAKMLILKKKSTDYKMFEKNYPACKILSLSVVYYTIANSSIVLPY